MIGNCKQLVAICEAHLLLTLAMIYPDDNSHAYGTEPCCHWLAIFTFTFTTYVHLTPIIPIYEYKQLTSPPANNHVILSLAFIFQLR